MAYVDQVELSDFVFEVCQGFLNYCTKSKYEHDIEAPDRDELNLNALLEIRRFFNGDELETIAQLMEQPITVQRYNTIYLSDDFLEVLEGLIYLIGELEQLTDKQIKIQYKSILSKYASMNVDILYSRKIHTRIRGVRGAQKRYQDVLYKKHQVIFDFMLNKAKEQGKWQNLNAAVDSVLSELDIVLKQFDKEWIATQLAEKTKNLVKLQQEFDHYKQNLPRYKLGSAKIMTATRAQTYTNKIREIRVECSELNKALNMQDPSILLKKQLPFNTAYQPEVIKNLLRKQEDLLAQIIESCAID
ncbi:hypothetical protein [Acinetobacter sp. AG3]|uniref:hypothetical protein n=1 Tax=Acinetobacter TaxID=469 RepID=UPI001EF046E1|nr:hypothetical protein [Acinetobacter sp. AG3]MCG7220095.1 hypothetical protein [Acinetobacter sp. AG3]